MKMRRLGKGRNAIHEDNSSSLKVLRAFPMRVTKPVYITQNPALPPAQSKSTLSKNNRNECKNLPQNGLAWRWKWEAKNTFAFANIRVKNRIVIVLNVFLIKPEQTSGKKKCVFNRKIPKMTLGKRKISLNSLCHNLILSSNCYICQQCKNKFIADLKFGFICMCVLHKKTLCGLYTCSHSLDYHFMVHRTPKQATCVFHAQVWGVGEGWKRDVGSL